MIQPETFIFLPAAFFLFGLVFGSFLNVCIYRMPREISVVSPRSACPACEAPIAGYDNIPVLSWLILRGKCRKCKAPISARYMGVELLTGALFALSFFAAIGRVPNVIQSVFLNGICSELHRIEGLLDWSHLAVALKFCVFSFLLLGLIFTDAETKLLPDS